MTVVAADTAMNSNGRSRTADYTIEGFLYQFNKTLHTILHSPAEAEVTVEGIVEDIEVQLPEGTSAIQCKYHEGQEKFTTSLIYKPLLQMMYHFHFNSGRDITYVLFAYFPDLEPGNQYPIARTDVEAALDSKNQKLQRYTGALKGKVDIDDFLSRFSMEVGPQYDDLVAQVCSALAEAGIPEGEIDTLAYPNAISVIASLSIRHDAAERIITRRALLEAINSVRKTAVNRWTLALRTRKQILLAKRKQLSTNLGINTRLRYMLVNAAGLEDFEDNMVLFLSDFVAKYHSKAVHIRTPLVGLNVSQEVFVNFQHRLFQKGIICTDGYDPKYFDEGWFFRDPMITGSGQNLRREFSLRLFRWTEESTDLLNRHRCDDLYIFGTDDLKGTDTRDINVEVLAANNLKEIGYMMGVYNDCD